MQKRTRILSASLILVMSAPLAMADGFYADISYNDVVATLDFETPNFDNDFDFGAVGLRGGYEVMPYFAVEGEVLVGTADETRSFVVLESDLPAFTVDYRLSTSVSAFGRANMPVGERFTAFARLGYSTVEYEIESNATDAGPASKDNHSGPAYGLGATFDVTEKIYLRGDFTRYVVDEFENDAISIGAGLRF